MHTHIVCTCKIVCIAFIICPCKITLHQRTLAVKNKRMTLDRTPSDLGKTPHYQIALTPSARQNRECCLSLPPVICSRNILDSNSLHCVGRRFCLLFWFTFNSVAVLVLCMCGLWFYMAFILGWLDIHWCCLHPFGQLRIGCQFCNWTVHLLTLPFIPTHTKGIPHSFLRPEGAGRLHLWLMP